MAVPIIKFLGIGTVEISAGGPLFAQARRAPAYHSNPAISANPATEIAKNFYNDREEGDWVPGFTVVVLFTVFTI